MDPRLQEMLDHYEIRKTLSEYCHGCDRADEERMASAYAAESWDDHGAVQAPGDEFAGIMTANVLARSDSIHHLLGQSLIDVRGDEAGAETYFLMVSIGKAGEDGVRPCNMLGGRFVDTLVRENARWRIKHRVAVRDWSNTTPVESGWPGAEGMTPGVRSDADPGFAALGLMHSGIRAQV